MDRILTALSRATRNKLKITVLLSALGMFSAYAADEPQEPPKKIRRPIRLISRGEVKAAGAYREIPLADAPEAALSERASDVLQKQTGVQVNRAGAPGTQSLLGLRGSNPEQVEFFIEGMPLPKPLNAPLNLENLPLPLFRSVEIFPSFIPSHLPATNIGGALNFRLRETAADKTEYLTQVTGTSLLGSSAAAARLTDASLNFINFEQSRSRYSYLNNNGTFENTGDDKTETRTNEDFTKIGYTGFSRFALERWQLSALADFNHTDRGLPGTQNLPLLKTRRADDRVAAALSARRPLGENHGIQLFASGTLDYSKITDPDRELLFFQSQETLSPQVLAGSSYSFRADGFDAALHVRGRYQTIAIDTSKIAERREAQGMASIAWDRKLFRVAGQGGGTIGEDYAAQNAFFASAAKTFAQSGASGSAIAALRPLYFFGGDDTSRETKFLELYGQISSAYRAPSLYERFGDNVFVTPSENLRSERALTNSAGIKSVFPCPFGVTCSLRSEGWLTGAKDYIIFTQNSARTLIAVNASSAQIWGIENEALVNLPERFLLSLRYTWLDARDYGNIPYYQDKYLPLRPRHHAVATLTMFYKSLRFIGTVEYRGSVFRDRYNSYAYYLESKTLVDAGIDYIIDGPVKYTFNVTLKNITDNRDVDLIGYTVPGRYLLVKWMAQF